MNWFLAKIIYRIVCGDGRHTAQFDEQVRLVTAAGSEEALEKSRRIGLQEEETFYNQKQQLVRWIFVAVTELHSIDTMTDGAEVYSQIREAENADDYGRFVHEKAALLQQQVLIPALQIA